MQKNLLLLFVVVNCAMIQAGESNMADDKVYADYKNQQAALYQSALINALSDNDQAIDDQDKSNADVNDQEEKDSRKKQYDGIPGYWSTEPTVESETGRKFYQYAQHKSTKNSINKQFSEKAKNDKDKFNTEVLPNFKRRLEDDRYFINTYCVSALKDCRKDLTCYDKKGLSPQVFTNPHFDEQHEEMLYACAAKFASERGVNLTAEEMRMIAEHNCATKEFFNGIQAGNKAISAVRHEILNTAVKKD